MVGLNISANLYERIKSHGTAIQFQNHRILLTASSALCFHPALPVRAIDTVNGDRYAYFVIHHLAYERKDGYVA